MDEVILEHIDHVVEVNEGVLDGKNLHFAMWRAEDLHHFVSGTMLALHKWMWLSLEHRGAESQYLHFTFDLAVSAPGVFPWCLLKTLSW